VHTACPVSDALPAIYFTIKKNKLFAHLKNADLWRWRVEKVPIYGVVKLKKCRFMALGS
jgi:hypothetical protein